MIPVKKTHPSRNSLTCTIFPSATQKPPLNCRTQVYRIEVLLKHLPAASRDGPVPERTGRRHRGTSTSRRRPATAWDHAGAPYVTRQTQAPALQSLWQPDNLVLVGDLFGRVPGWPWPYYMSLTMPELPDYRVIPALGDGKS